MFIELARCYFTLLPPGTSNYSHFSAAVSNWPAGHFPVAC